jgi:hypothetical protein
MKQALSRFDAERIPEFMALEALLEPLRRHGQVQVLETLRHENAEFPLYGISLGSTDPAAPCLGLFGGVHGLERIGSQVVIAYLEKIVSLLEWDSLFQDELARVRLVFIPIINPVGIYLKRRSNGNHVDLMRNAPVEAEEPTAWVGGQRKSHWLPWYRGAKNAPMELESQAVCRFVESQMFSSSAAIALDVHSGFGFVDRLWFPYAKSRHPFPHLPETYALKEKLDQTLTNHVYQFEPQASNYVTHGDLWDYLYEKRMGLSKPGVFMPLTLEMGSWTWIKKNPIQMFSFLGPFNPVKPHRQRRTLRRHLLLFDFLLRATRSHPFWSTLDAETRAQARKKAIQQWYPDQKK